jgi:hypothetical protein
MTIDLRPLSELYREEIRRLRPREVDAIIARHRLSYSIHRLTAEAERLNPIKESLL